ncbi:tRNA (adenosine(37)-N6)-threonylcarbamoyltransferase complex dimerization subunit type 1 TsaB [soil metagenome]
MFVALETATDTGSVALGTGTALAGEVVIGVRTRHAESLLPALEFLLERSRVSRRDITAVVVGAGPGSFTGVRVAAATARGLAHGLGVPLFAYSSLAALADETAADRPVCALFDARRGEVYAACYERPTGSNVLQEIMAPAVLGVADLRDRMRDIQPFYAGEGAVRYAAELGIAPPQLTVPRASALLRLAAEDLASGAEAGRVAAISGWEPSYLRTSGAERGIRG